MKKITKKWIEFAEEDLKNAEILLKEKSYRGSSWHCHQAIEKILKAVIIEKRKRAKKIHDLVKLLKDSGIKLPEDLLSFLEELNLHYLPPRYPDLFEQLKKIYQPNNIKKVNKITKELFLWLRNYLNQK